MEETLRYNEGMRKCYQCSFFWTVQPVENAWQTEEDCLKREDFPGITPLNGVICATCLWEYWKKAEDSGLKYPLFERLLSPDLIEHYNTTLKEEKQYQNYEDWQARKSMQQAPCAVKKNTKKKPKISVGKQMELSDMGWFKGGKTSSSKSVI